MTGILELLIALAPLLTKLGLTLIDMFVSGNDAKKAAQQQFLNAIQMHLNDAINSVNGRLSYDNQDQALDEADKKRETPPGPSQ